MSDIEILLRELNDRMDVLEKKVDKLNEKIKISINASYGNVWSDDSTPLPLRTTEEIKTHES